jgi:hypothetical protein
MDQGSPGSSRKLDKLRQNPGAQAMKRLALGDPPFVVAIQVGA